MKRLFALSLPFFFASPSPAADLNGYTAQYECRADGPHCNVDVVALGNRTCDQVIYPSTPWSSIDWSKSTICLAPGDHTGKGTLTVPASASGTAGNYKVLRYYRSSDNDDDPWRQSAANQAKLSHLVLNGARYWLIHRITIDGTGKVYNAMLEFTGASGASSNIVNRILNENGEGVRVAIYNSDNSNTIQNSVLRNCSYRVGINMEGVQISGGPSDTHIVNNESYGCTKGFYMTEHLSPGTVVENNDFWVPPSLYTDCHGNYTNGDPNSPCAATKTTIGTKNGGTAQNPVMFIHNRAWGNRATDPNVCCADIGQGVLLFIGGPGSASLGWNPLTTGAKYTLVKDNILMDSQHGHSGYWDGVNHNSFIGNLVYRIHRFNTSYPSYGMSIGANRQSEFYLNTIIDNDTWAILSDTYGGTDNDVRCNVVINSGGVASTFGSGTQIENNAFFGAPVVTTSTSSANISGSGASDSKNTDFCFYRKLRTGPEQACIPNAKATTASPQRNACKSGTGLRLGVGINDSPLF